MQLSSFMSLMDTESDPLLELAHVQERLSTLKAQLCTELLERDRLKRELALRDTALDASTSHFMIVDARSPTRSILYVNRALAKAHGYEPKEMLGMSLGRLLKPGVAAPQAVSAMDSALRAGREFRAEVEGLRSDGSTFWIGFTSIGLLDARGELTHIVFVAADITSRLDAERKRQELQDRLMNEMREREQMAIELRLAQKLESVGRLAAGLAHEINTPIQYVSDSVHFLRGGCDDRTRLLDAYRNALTEAAPHLAPGALDAISALEREIDADFLRDEFPRAFARTLEGTERVANLVRAMKEFAHPDANEHSPADLNHALETTLIVCRNEYKYHAEVNTALTAIPPVICNVGELNQVFLNIIVNAAHAIQDSGKDCSEGRIRIATRVDASNVEITIADNGCGIARESLDKIFDPFFTTKEIGRGTGQGLSIARTIVVDKHGGDLRVDSEPGVGTTFTILLPVRDSVQEAA